MGAADEVERELAHVLGNRLRGQVCRLGQLRLEGVLAQHSWPVATLEHTVGDGDKQVSSFELQVLLGAGHPLVDTDQQHAYRGYAAGGADYISKPFDPWVLRAEVQVFVDLWLAGRRLATQPEFLRRQLRGNVDPQGVRLSDRDEPRLRASSLHQQPPPLGSTCHALNTVAPVRSVRTVAPTFQACERRLPTQ